MQHNTSYFITLVICLCQDSISA